MVLKLLFVVNEHPNEALAIPVANKVADALRKKGVEVVVHKVPFKETYLGRAISGEMLHTHSRHFDTSVDLRKIKEKVEPHLTIRFHCTPHTHKHFKSSDFSIEQEVFPRQFVVELAAAYKPLPAVVKKRIEKGTPPHVKSDGLPGDYLSETTSESLSREIGFKSEKFAKALAPIIHKWAIMSPKKRPLFQHGKIRKKPVVKKRAGRH